MFENKEIKSQQQCNKKIKFDPDSSPEAWEHYIKYYTDDFLKNNFNFDKLFYYNHYSSVGLKCGFKYDNKWLNYTNNNLKDCKGYNRLFALNKDIEYREYNGNTYCEATDRLGGETDFNFNEEKYKYMKRIIGNNVDALKTLEVCKDNHHRLANFSLIQGMGNLQGFKGRNRLDRLDVFIYKLDKYFKSCSSEVLDCSTSENQYLLIKYLDNFVDIYDYVKRIYFIEDKYFVEKIIKQGKLPINTEIDVIRYMNLAQEFWKYKIDYFNNFKN